MHSSIYIIGGAALEINGIPKGICRLRDSNLGYVRTSVGGFGRNIAAQLAEYGRPVQLITALGNDPRAVTIEKNCKDHGILLDHVLHVNATSAVLFSLFDGERDLLASINDMEIFEHLTPSYFGGLIQTLNSAKLCVIDANLSSEALSYLCNTLTVPIYYEPISPTKARRIGSNIGKCHTIKANRFEAAQLSGCSCDTLRGVYRSAEWFLQQGVQQVFISLGDEGVLYASRDSFGQIKGESIDIIDTSGAGDVLYAAIIDALLKGESIESAAEIGNHAAALHCASHHGQEFMF